MTQKKAPPVSNENLRVWSKVCQTDPDSTKKISGGNLSGMTSLPGTAVIQKATEIWGPMGHTWRFEMIEERYDEGGPIGVFPPPSGDPIHDTAVQKVIFGKSHTIKLRLYYEIQDGKIDESTPWVEAFGHTPYLSYNRKGAYYQYDEEAPKKSYTDAQKKCLSMLGFNADVFLGYFENPEYIQMRTNEARIEKARDKQAEVDLQIADYDSWWNKNLPILKGAVTQHDLALCFKTMLARVNAEKDATRQKELIVAKDARKAQLETIGEK